MTGALLTPMAGRDAGIEGADPASTRDALLASMRTLAGVHGWRRVTVDGLCADAGVAPDDFYDHFTSTEACFAVAVEEALERLLEHVAQAIEATEGTWAQRTAAGIVRLFRVLDDDPGLAWLCVVEPLNGNAAARRAREAAGARLAELLSDPASTRPQQVARPAVTGALWGMVEQHLFDPDAMSFDEGVSSAIYMVLAPVAGPAEALAIARTAIDPRSLRDRRASHGGWAGTAGHSRDTLALLHLRAHPGASNRELGAATGDRHDSQISRRLTALEREGLVRRGRAGRHNAWELTTKGQAMVADLQPEGG